nr:cache domain-containing protein [Leucobacter exalbidus]
MARVDTFFDGLFAPLARWLPELEQQLRAHLHEGPITGSQLVALIEPGAHAILDGTERPLYGAGFCASEAVVTTGNPLAWWQGSERSLLASSTFGPGQASIDLGRLEWYRVPERTGERHVAGPFVDYLCSNEITITSALPLIVDGTFWGVVCADVLVHSLESEMSADLASAENVTLVNASGRVVISTDPDYETGDRYAGARAEGGVASLGEDVRMVSSKRYPFALVVPA